MKKLFVIVFSYFILAAPLFAQEVSPFFVGINGWMTEKIGGHFEPLMASRLGPCKVADKAMNAKIVRIGGWNYSYDSANGINTKEFLAGLCRKVVDGGSLPLLQVPHTISDADLVTWINYFKAQGLDIKHWLIGNEPDHKGVSYQDVEAYTKRISSVIRDNVTGATIYAIGMSQIVNMSSNLWLLDNLGGKDSKGRYIIDVVSVHDYASQNAGNINWGNVDNVLGKVNSINTGRPANNQLKWMIGEFNTTWSNNIVDQWHTAYSFNAGQVFIRIAKGAIERGAWSVIPWSIEENGSSRGDFDLGMFDSKNGNNTPRSTAVHWTMLGRTLRSTYLPISASQGVTIASKDQYGYSLLIANDGATNCSFGLSFNGTMSFISGSAYNVAAYSTSVFTFDLTGKLLGQANYTPAMSDSWSEPATYPMTNSCDDKVLASIEIIAPKTKLALNESVTLSVAGKSSCQSVPATNVVWSTNAPGGVFKNSTKGVYKVTATSGGFSSEIFLTVTNDVSVGSSFKVEAESFTSFATVIKDQYDKDLQKENSGTSIGYFNQAGETVTYNITVPAAGEYDVVLKYCSDGAGTIGLKAGSGAEQTVGFAASTGSPWYSLPFASWPVSAVSKVTLAAGAQTLVITNKGQSINLDYLEFTSYQKDAVAPQWVCPLIIEKPYVIGDPLPYIYFTCLAQDDVDGDITDMIVFTGDVDYTKVGDYKLTYNVSDLSGNAAPTMTKTIKVVSTSLPKNSFNSDIKVYPNPSDGKFQIETNGDFIARVFDLSGKLILTEVIDATSTSIDLSNNNKGIYYLQFQNDDQLYTQKVVVF